ncbi:MAG: N-acetylmuramoyl-L-alanine amidase family protein [Actinomycetota bacterium]
MGRVRGALIALSLVGLVACAAPVPESVATATAPSPASASPEPSIAPEPSPSSLPVAAPGLLVVGPAGAGLAGAPGGPEVGRLRAGVVLPVLELKDGWARIATPCDLSRWMPVGQGEGVPKPEVIVDPGHGGAEPGAVGGAGLLEKEVNLDVSAKTVSALAAAGVPAVLSRSGDYRATLAFRVAIAKAAQPALLVSVHHNADPDGPRDRPGTETFYQFRSPDSKRLSGLIYEEVVKDLAPLGTSWVGDTDAGAKWRLNSRGGDYYGILRLAGQDGTVAVLAELAFVSNPAEEALLSRQDVRGIEAEALARGILRYRTTADPGSGFTTPYERKVPAGPGGGSTGCVDPS